MQEGRGKEKGQLSSMDAMAEWLDDEWPNGPMPRSGWMKPMRRGRMALLDGRLMGKKAEKVRELDAS